MIFRDFFAFNFINLFCKGDLLNIFVFFITFFFLCKICIPNGIPILLMFFVLRDNIDKFLTDDLANSSFELFLLTEGNLTRLLFKKVTSFIITYALIIFFISISVHFLLYNGSLSNFLQIITFYFTILLIFFFILALCSILINKQKNSYILINLFYPPLILPTVLLANLFLEQKLGLKIIIVMAFSIIIPIFFLLQISIKNILSE